jgi:hypothetical protein
MPTPRHIQKMAWYREIAEACKKEKNHAEVARLFGLHPKYGRQHVYWILRKLKGNKI